MTDPSNPKDGAVPDNWEEADSETFLDNEEVFVPERERQIQIIVDRALAAAGANPVVVELCCGSGRLAYTFLDRRADVRVIAYDASPTMLRQAAVTAGTHAGRLTLHPFRLEHDDWRTIAPPVDAVVSSLAIHHLEGPEKRKLYADILEMLKPGGVFVMADLVEPCTAAGKTLLAQQWDEEVARRSTALLGSDAGIRRFRELQWNYYEIEGPDPVDHPSPLVSHLDWLRQVGFDKVDLHYCLAGHAIVSAERPAAR